MKRLTLVLALVALVAGASYVVAQQVRDGSTSPTPGLSYWPMGGTDGSTNRVARLDPNGILKVTEEYPAQYQTDRTTLCVSEAVTRGLKFLGFWYCGPFAQRSLVVTRTGSGTAVDRLYLYLYGSDDNITYYPVMQDPAWSNDGVANAPADTALCDTMRVTVPARMTTAKFTFPQHIYPGRYLAIYAVRESTSGTGQTVTITAEGRMF